MTSHKNLKKAIRARMDSTGERYSTARMHILGTATVDPAIPNRVEGYDVIGGGSHPDTTAVHNSLLASGVTNPVDGEPFSDALLYGLGGGIGFLYAVFEYEGFDPMLSIGVRSTMMGHDFARTALERAGVGFELLQTGSAAKADKALDEALAAGLAPIVSVDDPSLPYSGLPEYFRTMSAQQVVVVGADPERIWLDDRMLIDIDRESYRIARAAYRKAKHHMMTIVGGPTGDLAEGIKEAIRATARNFVESPFKGFASNWGYAGQEKWARLMVDERDRKGWPRVFSTDALAFLGLRRIFESIEVAYTPPAAGRGIYGEFLVEAAEITGIDQLVDLGGQFAELGERWHAIAELAVSGHETFDRYRQLVVRWDALLDEQRGEAGPARHALFNEIGDLGRSVTFEDGFAATRFAELASAVESLRLKERRAVEAMASLV